MDDHRAPRSRILVALDVPTLAEAERIVHQTLPYAGGYKVGMELCNSVGTPAVIEAVSGAGGEVFVDLKFADIPNTVRNAARVVSRPGVFMFNVHCSGGTAMMQAAVEGASMGSCHPLVIGVTMLTSIDQTILQEQLHIHGTLADHVVHLAALAQSARLNGVVCSALEVQAIKQACGKDFIAVVPGIRPTWAETDDQSRTMTPADAIAQGADYIVIGRPITKPPRHIGTPLQAAQLICEEIERSHSLSEEVKYNG